MSDEKDRLGDKLHQAEAARENQWAHQRDEEILEKLRRKYIKAIPCPQCGQKLDARVAIGVGGWRVQAAMAPGPIGKRSSSYARASKMRLRFIPSRWVKRFSISSKSCVTNIAKGSIAPTAAPSSPPKPRSPRVRRDWPGWLARMVTARGSIRVCSRKFANALTPPQDHPDSPLHSC